MPEVGRHESSTYGEEQNIVANDNWLPDEKIRQHWGRFTPTRQNICAFVIFNRRSLHVTCTNPARKCCMFFFTQ